MNIAILAAGAGDMVCGSCLRDSALARALLRQGHEVSLIPLYTPIRTEGRDISVPQTFYGGINIWLQNKLALFRHSPRALDWLFDRASLLRWAGNLGAQSAPDSVADLTAAIIRGDHGNTRKELHRLIDFLRDQVHPRAVTIPNLMFIGAAKPIRDALGVPVVCELTGEDIFLDAMSAPNRATIRDLIRERTSDVSRFVSTTDYYAERMIEYLDVPRSHIDVVPTGLANPFFEPAAPKRESRPTVGFLARICPEKGLELLVNAILILSKMPGMENVRLRIAGYLGRRDRRWFAKLQRRVQRPEVRKHFEYLGEVDQAGKIAMLDSLDVLSVPTTWPEPKGIYVLEALARGVPVVQPEHGAFVELMQRTGGGMLVPPNQPQALAHAIFELLTDAPRRIAMGNAGRAAIEGKHTELCMANQMVRIFEELQ